MRKMLFTGFAPNQRFKDVLRAMKFLFLPWMYFKWIKGGSVLEAENWLKNFDRYRLIWEKNIGNAVIVQKRQK